MLPFSIGVGLALAALNREVTPVNPDLERVKYLEYLFIKKHPEIRDMPFDKKRWYLEDLCEEHRVKTEKRNRVVNRCVEIAFLTGIVVTSTYFAYRTDHSSPIEPTQRQEVQSEMPSFSHYGVFPVR